MKSTPIDAARAGLTDIVCAAQRGEPTTITRWGRPVAEVVPVGTHARASGPSPAPVGADVGRERTVALIASLHTDRLEEDIPRVPA